VEDRRPLPLIHRLSHRHWVALDVALAVLLAGTALLMVKETHAPPGPATYLATGAACLPLVVRRRWPRAVLAVVLLGEAALVAFGVQGPALLSAGFAMYSVVATATRPPYPIVATAIAVLVVAGTPNWDSQTFESIVRAGGAILIGFLAGQNASSRRDHALALAARAAEREREHARRTAMEERARIARELHDVVAHAMSVIAVRSGAARLVRDRRPDDAAEALSIIETISRRGLVELRRIVAVLREADEPSGQPEPPPGLGDLPTLVDQIGAAGVRVEVLVDGTQRPLPPTEDLCAYRIAQEALTNVVRHSGARTATLSLRYRPTVLEIECLDPGGSRARPVDAAPDGHGLVGMRERVAVFGGEFRAEPHGPGFRVLARLPVTQEAR
jgi:signal transduction histidine kinase